MLAPPPPPLPAPMAPQSSGIGGLFSCCVGPVVSGPPERKSSVAERKSSVAERPSEAGDVYVGQKRSVAERPSEAGDVYVGQMVGERREGLGRCTYVDGRIYDGEWIADEWHVGELTGKRGDVYTGDFLNGLRHGHGKQIYVDGRVYVGQWAFDKRNGRGATHFADNSSHEGEYRNDHRVLTRIRHD